MGRQSGGDFWASIQAEKILRQQDEQKRRDDEYREAQREILRAKTGEVDPNG